MKNELNNYNITNADSSKQSFANEGKLSFDNDKRGFICENAASDVDESARITEAFDEKTDLPTEEKESGSAELDASSASSASTASSAASASASVGGSVGALAGVVASSVAAAVVVVAVFISTLAISLSLLMADMHSLVFGVTITGAQEEDFSQPIYAILTSDDGTHLEQEVNQDTAILTFEGLEPGREYRLTVKNEEKVFAEVTAFTTTEPNEKGAILSSMQGRNVFVLVQDVMLKSTEYYTLTAKDAQGKVLYAKDGMDPHAEYRFELDEPKDVYLYLTVSGKTYAVSQCLLPDYDLTHGAWAWSDDFLTATVTFTDKRGGEPIEIPASVTRKKIDPTCEKDGAFVYTAEVRYNGEIVTDKQSTVIEALGHDYVGVFDVNGQITYTCSRCGDSYTNED